MITNDPTDDAFAQKLMDFFNSSAMLRPHDIYEQTNKIAENSYPVSSQPKNLMLGAVHEGILFDELDPDSPDNNQTETLKHYKEIVSDYLLGNFYPSYCSLLGAYIQNSEGYSWNVEIVDGAFKVTCTAEPIKDRLQNIAETVGTTGDDEEDLYSLQQRLPAHIADFSLTSSEIEESLN